LHLNHASQPARFLLKAAARAMSVALTYPAAQMAAAAPDSERARFIRRTYGHLAVAILAFAFVESWLLSLPIAEAFAQYAGNRFVWFAVLGGYMAIASVAEMWARADGSRIVQYLGLGVYVVAEACIFVPLLSMARMVSPDIIPIAAILTVVLSGGLTLVCFATRADFSGLRNVIAIGGFIALGMILCSALFGFGLGLLFSGGMILLAGATILYSTHCVLNEYHTNQHVAAALSLFAAIALLFWYIVRVLIQIYLAFNKN